MSSHHEIPKHLRDSVTACLHWNEDSHSVLTFPLVRKCKYQNINLFPSRVLEEDFYRIEREHPHPNSVKVFPAKKRVEQQSDVLNQSWKQEKHHQKRPKLRWGWQREEWQTTMQRLSHVHRKPLIVPSVKENERLFVPSRPATALPNKPHPPHELPVNMTKETNARCRPLSARIKKKIAEIATLL